MVFAFDRPTKILFIVIYPAIQLQINHPTLFLQTEERKDSDDEKSDRNRPWWRKRFVSAMPKGNFIKYQNAILATRSKAPKSLSESPYLNSSVRLVGPEFLAL